MAGGNEKSKSLPAKRGWFFCIMDLGYMKQSKFTISDVQKIADLAHIPVTDDQAKDLATGFTTTMRIVDELADVDITNVEQTNQVTGLENVFRDDEIDTPRMFTQEQALANGKRTHNGFFVVDQVLDEK